MKNLLLLLFIAIAITSCSTARRSSTTSSAQTVHTPRQSSPKFIENISINPSGKTDKSIRNASSIPSAESNISASDINHNTDYSLQFKYAILLDIPVEEVTDQRLIEFIDSWYGTPYRYGGNDHAGIDCSAFVQSFFAAMYTISLPRTSLEQFARAKRISKKDLEEGDLVFFKTSGRSISHVGVYLRNNKFVHAATSGGVMISDITEDYFARRFAGSGRVKE